MLGSLEAEVGDRPLHVGGPKPRALLAALLIGRGGTITVDRLIDVLWGERPPPTAVKTVHKYVSQLRAEIGAVVQTRPNGYRLDVNDDAVDARRLEALVALAGTSQPFEAVGLLEEALALWRGVPYPELESDDLALAERTRLEELRLSATEDLFQARLDCGQHQTIIGPLEEHVALHPFKERLWAQLMLAYYRSGRQSEALRAYRRVTTLLGDELGIEPSTELQSLEERILLHDPTLDFTGAKGQTNLRPRLNSFIGRIRELAELSPLLAGSRLLTLTGPAGSGKTRLATELAEKHLSDFRHGVWLIDLAPITSPDQVADAMAKPFGVSGSADRPTEAVLSGYLANMQILLVIDNCEHLATKVASLTRDMLEGNPGLRILATSRERLGIPGEVGYPVPPLPYPEEGGEIETVDSVRLFADRARNTAPDFEISSGNRQAVAEICRRLDGIPLAIELAAARVNSFSPGDLAAHLDHRFALLGSSGPTASSRHKTLRGAIDWSYDLLDDLERTLFRRLSVFQGGFDLEAAIEVCGYGPLDLRLVLSTIPQLVDKSLITVDRPAQGATRYRLLEMLREYGRDQLEASDSSMLRNFHAGYFARMAEAALMDLRGPGQRECIRRLSIDHDNIRKALRWADAQQPEVVVRMAVALARYWDAVGPRTEGHEWLRRAVELSDTMDPDLKVMARVAASDVFSSMRASHSRRYAEDALAEARRAGDKVGVAQAQRALCWALALDERLEESLQAGLAALEAFERLGDKWELAFCLERLGQSDYRDLTTSAARLEEARSLYAQVGDRTREAVVLYKLAALHAQRGEYERGMVDAGRSLDICRELGSLHDEGHALLEYGRIIVRAGEPARALPILEQALERLTKMGDDRCSVRTLAVLGTALVRAGDSEKADQVLRNTLTRASDLDDLQSIRTAAVGMADLFHMQGRVVEAVRLYSFVNTLAHQGGPPLIPSRRMKRNEVLEDLRSHLDQTEFALAWSEGETMTIDDAKALVGESRL